MASGRNQAAATQLADGRILLAGGFLPADWERLCKGVKISSYSCVGPATATAEIYDPRTKSFSPTGSMTVPRRTPQAVLLHDGRVLVVGGGDFVGLPLGTAEVYDPTTGRFTGLGAIHQDTSGDAAAMPPSLPPSDAWRTQTLEKQTVTVLADGRVLIAGGEDSLWDSSNAVTIFDPTTNTFANLPGMPLRWSKAAASLLADGHVLFTGGLDSTTNLPTTQALLFDPATNHFTITGPTVVARAGTSQTVLRDGRVLIVNGMIDPYNEQPNCGNLIPAELYDPSTGRFSPASSTNPSNGELPVLVPDGRVLLFGGTAADQDCTSLLQVEAYDPDSGTFALLASGVLPKDDVVDHAFALDDGSVLLLMLQGGDYVMTLE